MHESEANIIVGESHEIPPEILSRFAESRRTVTKRTLIPWSEHCTECAWPTCYQTCDLYEPRTDGKCRRFREGMVRIDHKDALNSYLLKISFKRWAKLWAPAHLTLHTLEAADRAEQRDLRIAGYIQAIPWNPARNAVSGKRYSLKKRLAVRASGDGELPHHFLIECYNPNSETVSITLSVRTDASALQFQKLFHMCSGFNRYRVAASEISRMVDLSRPLQIDLTPNEIADGLTLYFGAMDFVVDPAFETSASTRAAAGDPAKPRICKCVVWDLDNTLWDGTLMEDGAENIRLKPGVRQILMDLDRRGILISAASKNDYEDAVSVLRRFEIEEYFVFPQISWNPKSQAIEEIAKNLNIGIDSLLFIDDSPFEIAQVSTVLPDVMVMEAARYEELLELPECQGTATEEGRQRRLFYRDLGIRQRAEADFHGDYGAFLAECNMRMVIVPMDEANLERVHELTQRTNQMNFSGNRYSRQRLSEFLGDESVETCVIDCTDRFGSYGVVGFCVVSLPDTRMIDLMFSCRIQGKRVEHAFISYLLRKYAAMDKSLTVDYRRTKRTRSPERCLRTWALSHRRRLTA